LEPATTIKKAARIMKILTLKMFENLAFKKSSKLEKEKKSPIFKTKKMQMIFLIR